MRTLALTLSVLLLIVVAPGAAPAHKTRHVILLMTDGVRWQDVFTGADPQLLDKENGKVENVPELRTRFWRDDPRARREALMPFLWNVVAHQGQIYGNRALESDVHVTNGKNFSYPGYSELLCGFPDPRIDSNDNIPNPNATVLEWLSQKPEYRNRIAAFGSWETFPFILNVARSGLFVNAGYDPLPESLPPPLQLLNRIKIDTGIWRDETLDGAVFPLALSYFKLHKPRILFVGLGDTDEWAHQARYDMYLKALHRVDGYARELWETAQSLPDYRGKTTLIVAVDHGRGAGPQDWPGHGLKYADSKDVWLAFLGPDTPPLGERARIPSITESQVAATLAAFLGQDYHAAVPQSGEPIAHVFGR